MSISRLKDRRALPVADLIERCLAGDARAWDEIVERYGRLVYSIPRRYGFSDADADDVFQEVFVILYRKLDQLRDADRFSAWLVRTTHRECYRIGRRRGRDPEPGLPAEPAEADTDAEDDAERWERCQVVREALRRLGGPCEELLTMLFQHSEPPAYEVIATRLNMKIGSIGPTRARCFRKLERILTELGLPDEVSQSPSDSST